MKRIIPGLWLVDEIGDFVNCYVWEWRDGLTLIDSGRPGTAAILLQALRDHGWPLHNLRRVLVTHGDSDHVGGLPLMRRAAHPTIACHSAERPLLEQIEHRAFPWYGRPLGALVTRLPSNRVEPVTPDELLEDGQVTPEGFTVIHTPGHTPGHVAFLHRQRRLLVCGDMLSNRKGKLSPSPKIVTPDRRAAARSVYYLAKRYGNDFDLVAFGHGPPILQNGGKRIKAFASQAFSTEM